MSSTTIRQRHALAALLAMTWGGGVLAIGPIEHEIGNLMPAGIKSEFAIYTEPVGQHRAKHTICTYPVNGSETDGFTFTWELTEAKQPTGDPANHAGHRHDVASRPLGDLRYGGSTGKRVGPAQVNSYCSAPVEYLLPEVSGKISGELFIQLPSGWRTIRPQPFDASHTSWKYLHTYDIGLSWLSQLPAGNYIKSRNSDKMHVDNEAFAILPVAQINLETIAHWFQYVSQRLLSVNDISLPRGGLFDIKGSWSGSHRAHRYGASVDINRDGVNCEDNFYLRGIVKALMPDRSVRGPRGNGNFRYGRLLCESGGRTHLDLELFPTS